MPGPVWGSEHTEPELPLAGGADTHTNSASPVWHVLWLMEAEEEAGQVPRGSYGLILKVTSEVARWKQELCGPQRLGHIQDAEGLCGCFQMRKPRL